MEVKMKHTKSNISRINVLILALMIAFIAFGAAMQVEAASMKLSRKSATLTVGKSVTLKVKGTSKKVKWSSSDKKIASVSNKGKVKAKKAGKATIYAKVGSKKLKCKVTVKASSPAPLSEYWAKDSAPAKSVIEYVQKVTDASDKANYIPEKDRIAVFDMDGTLTCETYFTYYDTMMFIEYCLKEDHGVSEELKEAARVIDPDYKAGEDLARNFAKAYAGMTIDEFYDYVESFGEKYTESFNNMRYKDGFYLPMVELVKYLYDNGFTIYVVSGTERTTTRAIVANSPIAEYVTPNHVIGTEFEVKLKGHETDSSNMTYTYADGDELVLTGGFIQKNLNANKVIYIEREIGKRPVLAFGNSSSDTSMMDYTIDSRNKYPAEAYMIVNDDAVREWGPDNWNDKSAKFGKDSGGMGYTMISMKNDFAKIYPDEITKAENQYTDPNMKSASYDDPDQEYTTDESGLKNAA